ncbi:MAG: hypothetical protein ACLR6L_03515 [Agathobaculum sp.]
MSKMREYLHNKYLQVGCTAALAVGSALPAAFALDGDAASTSNAAVMTAINQAASSVKSDSAAVIAAGIGLGVIFWGARVLWRNFRSLGSAK